MNNGSEDEDDEKEGGTSFTMSWSGGGAVSYNNWLSNEPRPGPECAALRMMDHKWMSSLCHLQRCSLCEGWRID